MRFLNLLIIWCLFHIGSFQAIAAVAVNEHDQDKANHLTLHGFDLAHKRGLQGQGETFCLIEQGCDLKHPAFVECDIRGISTSLHETCPLGFQDKSKRRYKSGYDHIIAATHGDYGHGTHVLGIVVSNPAADCYFDPYNTPKEAQRNNFVGGIAPKASAVIVSRSQVQLHAFWQLPTTRNMSTALYSFKDADTITALDEQAMLDFDFKNQKFKRDIGTQDIQEWLEHRKKYKELIFGPLRNPDFGFYHEKIDDSLYSSFKESFTTGARVINCSFKLDPVCDSLKEYHIAPDFIEMLATNLSKNDQILVLAANNDSINLETDPRSRYFQQLAAHPLIGPRLLIALNFESLSEGGNKVKIPTGQMINLKLFGSSNWPGKKLAPYAVGAFGTNVFSPRGMNYEGLATFGALSGTSQAAPIISSLGLLVDQYYKKLYKPLTGVEIVTLIKKTAIPVGKDPEKYGLGLINAWDALDLIQ